MQVHLFKGPERIFAATRDADGANLPRRWAPWSPFKTVEMIRGERMPGIDVDECLDDLAAYGFHVTDAHVRVPPEAIGHSS